MDVYFISGLCTSCEAFKNIVLPTAYRKHFLEWIEPLINETLPAYITRLTSTIDTTKPFAIVGLSFGGMIAVELNKKLKPVDTIIISSTPTFEHIPFLYRVTGTLKLYRFATVGMIHVFRPVVDWFIGVKRSNQEKELLRKTLENLSPVLLRWSLKQVTLCWRNTVVPKKYFHIHGTADRLLPVGKMKPDVMIENGSHFMIVSHGKEISEAITQRLAANL